MLHGMSTVAGKNEIKKFLQPKLRDGMKICDMGPGTGTYRRLLGDNFEWTGVEIWHETAQELKTIYNHIYEMDMRNFNYPEDYDLVIFGDVLEHMTIEEAQECIRRARLHSKMIIVAFPYNTIQNAIYGNPNEEHIQYNFSPEKFDQHYPGFKRIYYAEQYQYAYYYWEKKD